MTTSEPRILGRLDLMLQFAKQFGDEDAYLAVECKRVAAGNTTLNRRYVQEGVQRFQTGYYSAGHRWAIMLAYVLVLPVKDVVADIEARLVKDYGRDGRLRVASTHALALEVMDGELMQGRSHVIWVKHVFVDMVPAS